MGLIVVDEDRNKRLMAMGQMAASLAHEIRNPLGSMELYCTLLKKDLSTQPTALQLAEQIHSGIRTLDRIISNCLQFTRQVKPRLELIDDPDLLLSEAIEQSRHKSAAEDVEVIVEQQHQEQLRVDCYLVKQILLNLLTNALEAAQFRAKVEMITPVVEVHSRIADAWELQIKDNGCGIPEELLPTVFDPFVSTKEGGTGLGLAIVASIVAAHQGTIKLQPNEGGGCIAWVSIPNPKESV